MTSAPARFSSRLREHTRTVHLASERTSFMGAFVRGDIDRPRFEGLVSAYLDVYEALEETALSLHDHPLVGAFPLGVLARRQALVDDLSFLVGDSWREVRARNPAAQALASRIRSLPGIQPERVVAHLYVRYLGDLSGGQVLAGIAAKALGLQERGLSFYRFSGIPDIAAFKESFREKIDATPEPAQAGVMEEAALSFTAAAAIFSDVESPRITA